MLRIFYWEQRKFKMLVNRESTITDDIRLPRVEYEDISSNSGKLNKNIYLKDNNKRGNEFEPNDILFGKLRPYLNKWLYATFKGIAVGDFWVLRTKELNSKYIFYLLQTSKFKNVSNISTGTKMPRADWTTVSNKTFIVPTNLNESERIGILLSTLDAYINLHQRKINTFKQLKKSFLSGMFPIKGENTPRLRFNGYKEEWEQRKLGEVTDVRDGTHDSPKYFKEGYPLITSKNLKNDGLDLDNVSLISKEDFNKFNKRSKVHKGDILFGMIGTIGNPILINRDDFAIKNIALIKQSHEVLNVFIIQLLKSPVFQSYINRENEGGTQKFLSLGKIRDFSFKSPNSEEQNAVSNFLRNLDKSIALHQNKVTNLSILKTTYLRKMFL